ncbi:MAG: hypothetical protein SF053_05020 [Bacteroidia bacterium]|nr:hypothetical protein [Bacteroidia bacterium]
MYRCLLAAWMLCAPFWGLGQGLIREDSAFVPFEQMMDSVFGLVDLSGVSSHHLISRAPVLVPIDQYDGSIGADTACLIPSTSQTKTKYFYELTFYRLRCILLSVL